MHTPARECLPGLGDNPSGQAVPETPARSVCGLTCHPPETLIGQRTWGSTWLGAGPPAAKDAPLGEFARVKLCLTLLQVWLTGAPDL